MYDINNNAYSFELIQNTSSIFDNNIINATYIIHLEGNGRLEHIKRQITKFKTTNLIYILHNQGYKTGKKDYFINKPPLDLVDAYLTIFKHSKNNNYQNILIFEDDFICDEKLLDTNISSEITQFIYSKNKHNKLFVYYLGVIPFILKKYNEHHMEIIGGIGCHSIIYSSKFIDKVLDIHQEHIQDWDMLLSGLLIKEDNSIYFSFTKRYVYKQCLCYQPVTETDNKSYWGKCLQEKSSRNKNFIQGITQHLTSRITGIYVNFLNNSINLLDLDKEPINGTKLLYDICIKL
jgi:hypothetical protein